MLYVDYNRVLINYKWFAWYVWMCNLLQRLRTYLCHVEIMVNLLKPTGYVMHHQFNIQQLYALPTLYLYVLYLSENKQRLMPLTA